MFDGNAGGSKVSLSGASRGRQRGAENRSEFLKRQHKERDARETKRMQERSARMLQAVFRGWRSRRLAGNAHRALFDKRCADIAKVEKLLPPDQRAKFIFAALMPLLRMFAFFFNSREDIGRSTKAFEMVQFSGQQQPSCNVFYLGFGAEDVRHSFMVVFERLVQALLRGQQIHEVVQLLQTMQRTTSSCDAAQRSAIIERLLRRTSLLVAISRDGFCLQAPTSPEISEAADSVLLLCAGIAMCPSDALRRQHFLYLLSAPRLWEDLAAAALVGSGSPLSCLLQVSDLVPELVSLGDEWTHISQLLQENISGCSRWVLLFENLTLILRALLQTAGDVRVDRLPLWLAWIALVSRQITLTDKGTLYASKCALLYTTSFVRVLFQQVDCEDSQGLLLHILNLYFPADTELEPVSEAVQALAFATPIVERLLPSLMEFASASVAVALDLLGANTGAFDTPSALKLHAFCRVYDVKLQSLYDAEFSSPANPLSSQDVALLAPALNRIAYQLVTTRPAKQSLQPQARLLRAALSRLVCALCHRHLRRPIITDGGAGIKWWIIPDARSLLHRAPVVDLGIDEARAPGENEDDPMDVDAEASPAGAVQPARRRKAVLGGDSAAREVLEAVLEELPHVLPFEDRVALLHNVILSDQDNRMETRAPWVRSELPQHSIRRNFLVEDGFAAFNKLNDEDSLRGIFKVEFVAPDGTPESGIDGGGLFKEFMIHVCRSTFDPDFGLFTTTEDQTLYPSPNAFRVHRNAAELYQFLGKVVGKALYEMTLLEAQFSLVFFNRMLDRTNEVDDVAALDKELHRGMLRLKENERVEDLGLTFSISTSQFGLMEDIDLIPNGRDINVTKENLTQYLHVVANFRTNLQIQRHSDAFVQGLQKVLPLAWLKMFDPYELNTLISGSSTGFDVADLKQHTLYGGGYREDSPVVIWLWTLLESHLDAEDMGRFLMFTTSCSRPPLLGFKTLFPKFCIHRVPDAVRLPTASTCANLLKLPDYQNFETLKMKLTQAIRAECGFDLS